MAATDAGLAKPTSDAEAAVSHLDGSIIPTRVHAEELDAVIIAEQEATNEFGPQDLKSIPYTELNLLSQMRKLYEAEPLEELSASIDLHGLMHQLTVAELTPESCQEYLDGINKVWKSEHQIGDLTPNADGNYFIVIAGHRRYLAVGRIIADKDLDPSLQTVISNVHQNIPPYEALKRQISENVYTAPKPHEFAYAIRELYEVGLMEKRFSSVGAFAKEMPFGIGKIRGAVRYCMLPGKVRQLVENNFLSYQASLELVPLLQAYLEREDPEDAIEEKIYTAAIKVSVECMTAANAKTFVQGRLNALLDNQGDLASLMDEAADAEVRRQIEEALAERRQIIREYSTNAIGGVSKLLEYTERGLLGKRDLVLDVEGLKMHMQNWRTVIGRILVTSETDTSELEVELEEVRKLVELLPGQEEALFAG